MESLTIIGTEDGLLVLATEAGQIALHLVARLAL